MLLSEFRFLIQHIPGVQNVVADGLTRVMSLSSNEIPRSKRRIFVEDRIPHIFRLGREGLSTEEHPGMIEDDDEEGALGLKDLGEAENVVSLQDITIP